MSPYIIPGLPVFDKGNNLIATIIMETVCLDYDVDIKDVIKQKRDRNVALTRQVAMWCVKNGTLKTLNEIGKMFGNRDHTTVIHSIRKIDDLAEVDMGFKKELEGLIEKIESNVSTRLPGKHIKTLRRPAYSV